MITELTPIYCDNIPDEKEQGILYISKRYWCAIHLCACGCGGQVVTPLKTIAGVAGWNLTEKEGKVSLTPSIGNWSGENPYHAHYFITENKIVWC